MTGRPPPIDFYFDFISPFFIVDDQPIWGADRLWMIEHWLRHGSWERTPETPL